MQVFLSEEQTNALRSYIYEITKESIEEAKRNVGLDQDILKQKHCADAFNVSVNTFKSWIAQGAPEIRLDSGMVLYSKSAITQWLLEHQK